MADKKLEKALYGPSVTEVALGAVLGLLCGVLVACVYLVFKPVKQVNEMPKERVRGVVYYIPGSESSAKGRDWSNQERKLIAGMSVTLVEDELNAWASSIAAPAAPAPKPGAKGKPGDSKPAAEGFLIPGPLNFKIINDKVQIGMKCTLNWYGLTYDTTVVATGGFQKSDNDFVFKADKLYLGSCPLHFLPLVPKLLVANLAAKEKLSDDLRIALNKLGTVTIENGTLKLAVQ